MKTHKSKGTKITTIFRYVRNNLRTNWNGPSLSHNLATGIYKSSAFLGELPTISYSWSYYFSYMVLIFSFLFNLFYKAKLLSSIYSISHPFQNGFCGWRRWEQEQVNFSKVNDLKKTLLWKIFRHLNIANHNLRLAQVKFITISMRKNQAQIQKSIPLRLQQFFLF